MPFRGPLQADRAVAPRSSRGESLRGAEKGQGVVGTEGQGALADDDAPRVGPLIERGRVGRLATVVGGQKDVRWWIGMRDARSAR